MDRSSVSSRPRAMSHDRLPRPGPTGPRAGRDRPVDRVGLGRLRGAACTQAAHPARSGGKQFQHDSPGSVSCRGQPTESAAATRTTCAARRSRGAGRMRLRLTGAKESCIGCHRVGVRVCSLIGLTGVGSADRGRPVEADGRPRNRESRVRTRCGLSCERAASEDGFQAWNGAGTAVCDCQPIRPMAHIRETGADAAQAWGPVVCDSQRGLGGRVTGRGVCQVPGRRGGRAGWTPGAGNRTRNSADVLASCSSHAQLRIPVSTSRGSHRGRDHVGVRRGPAHPGPLMGGGPVCAHGAAGHPTSGTARPRLKDRAMCVRTGPAGEGLSVRAARDRLCFC